MKRRRESNGAGHIQCNSYILWRVPSAGGLGLSKYAMKYFPVAPDGRDNACKAMLLRKGCVTHVKKKVKMHAGLTLRLLP